MSQRCVLLAADAATHGQVGMEMWARWAHKALWHDFAPGWSLHKSHHAPRLGPFEANDVFAIVNAAPAIGLCGYGFLTPTIFGGICFGAGESRLNCHPGFGVKRPADPPVWPSQKHLVQAWASRCLA